MSDIQEQGEPLDIVCPKGLADPQLLQRALDAAFADEQLMASLGGIDNIAKIVYVEGRMLNFVLKGK
jgi:hypothetical protein